MLYICRFFDARVYYNIRSSHSRHVLRIRQQMLSIRQHEFIITYVHLTRPVLVSFLSRAVYHVRFASQRDRIAAEARGLLRDRIASEARGVPLSSLCGKRRTKETTVTSSKNDVSFQTKKDNGKPSAFSGTEIMNPDFLD